MFDNSDAHMGHYFLNCMKQRPDVVCQIDAATGEEETNASVMTRSIRLAQALRKLGFLPGDVLALGGKNHLDLHIPYYAAILNGFPIAGVDPLFKIDEVRVFFKLTAPKIAFCEPKHYDIYATAAADLGLDTRVVTFGTGDHSMQELIDNCPDNSPIEEFEPARIDQEKIYAWLVSSGGTTGVIKVAAVKHSTWREKMKSMIDNFFKSNESNGLSQTTALNLSPVQWVSGFFNALSMPLLHQTKVQTSAEATPEHIIDIINKYRPVSAILGPSPATGILNSSKPCDFSCFRFIFLTGGKIYADLVREMKNRVGKNVIVMEVYGQTENLGPVLAPNPFGPIGACGRPGNGVELKLVDHVTEQEIKEPNVTGELWTKGSCFSEYYNNPEETAKAFTEDGWYKTGDLLYRDEDDNYYFVERLKMLIKYRNYHIIPSELEEVIRSYEGVKEVSVTSIPHEEDGEHAVACVVRAPGSTITEENIKNLVADKLSETKQLRGGVLFMDTFPMTSSGKVARARLRQIVANIFNDNCSTYSHRLS